MYRFGVTSENNLNSIARHLSQETIKEIGLIIHKVGHFLLKIRPFLL